MYRPISPTRTGGASASTHARSRSAERDERAPTPTSTPAHSADDHGAPTRRTSDGRQHLRAHADRFARRQPRERERRVASTSVRRRRRRPRARPRRRARGSRARRSRSTAGAPSTDRKIASPHPPLRHPFEVDDERLLAARVDPPSVGEPVDELRTAERTGSLHRRPASRRSGSRRARARTARSRRSRCTCSFVRPVVRRP